ncbi:hypothetical protein BDY17DRAFT_326866 [Neohortaea acidophila]|uniref:Uncharacterized protein n=1 Tax=Neohortaea acidophila TaxID=245834 RepID=A0A6A6PIJ4_9PEZI|nr:uncharacterized protein BDY17DRAFT_326866 [Neohortaea acidophila]KAF2479858.1 hypothetical protein BDY17DRAFT_326866 [Neohortaea acidophila]
MPLLRHCFPIHVSLIIIDPNNPNNPASLHDFPDLPEFDLDRQLRDPNCTDLQRLFDSSTPHPQTPRPIRRETRTRVHGADFEGEAIVFDVLIDGHEVARVVYGNYPTPYPNAVYVVPGVLAGEKVGGRMFAFVALDVREDGEEGEEELLQRGGGEQTYQNPEFGSVVVHVSHVWGRTAPPEPGPLSEIRGIAPVPDAQVLSLITSTSALPIHRTKLIGTIIMHYRGIDSLCAGGILPDYRDAAAMSGLRKQVVTKLSRNELVALVQWYEWRDERAARERQMAEQGKGKGRERMEDAGAGSASAKGHTTGAGGMNTDATFSGYR